MANGPGSARLAAAAVHVFTASGAVCGWLAAMAMIDRAYELGFAWLGLALVIDGIDGTFARMARVKERLPRFSGDVLDLVVDYVTYVFVPVLALHTAGLFQGYLGLLLEAGILLSSLFHFSDTASKDADNHFVGFPAVWNVVAFYLLAFAASPSVAAAAILLAIGLTFVPWSWVHPLRVVEWRGVTLAATLAWSAAAVSTIMSGFPVRTIEATVLLAVAAYVVALSLWWRLRADG